MSTVAVIVVVGAIGFAVWFFYTHRLPPDPTKRVLCPYCGKEVNVKLEPNEKEKKP